MVITNEWIAINGTFKNTKDITNYFKWANGWDFVICDYWASSYYITPAVPLKPKSKCIRFKAYREK